MRYDAFIITAPLYIWDGIAFCEGRKKLCYLWVCPAAEPC